MQIAEDGQKRFYGATSNLHILHNGPMSLTRSRFSSLQKEGELLLKNRQLDQFVDREFEDHLLKLYFCWEDPSIHVMDEDLFFREREKCKFTQETSYLYSEVLVNAMYRFSSLGRHNANLLTVVSGAQSVRALPHDTVPIFPSLWTSSSQRDLKLCWNLKWTRLLYAPCRPWSS